mgnify:CR=1 FL=1
MSRYYDYFEEQRHTNGEVTIDEFIAEAMRTDLKFETLAEELQYQRTSRITLMNELLTCYQYLKEHDMLLLYEAYRNGEELPFYWASDNKYGGHMTAEKLIYTFYLTNPLK